MVKETGKRVNPGAWVVLGVILALVPEKCYAWGAGFHIADGLFMLSNLSLIAPPIASSLSLYPYDYLYGCISADIFIGKGYKRRDDHCHNWSVAFGMLSRTSTESEKAFMYGYLTHLATDVIPHNFFIPNQLYITPTSRRMGHVYWELRSDVFMDPKIWKVAMRVIARHNKANDRFIKKAMRKTMFPFFAKKRVYFRSIKINNIKLWRRALSTLSNFSKWEIKKDEIMGMNSFSLALTIDFLNDPEKGLCLRYDPVGTDNMIAAKKARKRGKKNAGQEPLEKIFHVPREIEELAASSRDTIKGLDFTRLIAESDL